MTREELDHTLRPLLARHAQTLRLATGALMLATVAFAFVCAITSPRAGAPVAADLSVEQVLTPINLTFALMVWTMSFVVPRWFRAQQMPGALDAGARGILAVDHSARVIELALRACTALVGLAVVLDGATAGLLRSAPWIWVNALPAGFFVLHALATLPSPHSISDALAAGLAHP